MTKDELRKLEDLLEKLEIEYGEELSNDRFLALTITKETICDLILTK